MVHIKLVKVIATRGKMRYLGEKPGLDAWATGLCEQFHAHGEMF